MLHTDNSNAKVPQFIVEPLFVAGAIEMYIAALAAFISGATLPELLWQLLYLGSPRQSITVRA